MFSKIADLRIGQTNAAVRRKASNLSRSFAPVNQRWQAYRNLDRAQRIQPIAGLDLLAHLHLAIRRFYPGFIWRCPRRAEDDRVGYTQPGRKREFRIAYADLLRLGHLSPVLSYLDQVIFRGE